MSAQMTMVSQQVLQRLTRLPVKAVQRVLLVLLVVWMVLAVVQLLTVLLVPVEVAPTESSGISKPVPTGKNQQAVDIAKLQDFNLFGNADPAAIVTETETVVEEVDLNAAKTKLNVTLEGLVYSSDPQQSIAVIVYQGKQDQYAVGAKLPLSGNVKLARVLTDHVILDNNGSFESLWLYDEEKRQLGASGPATEPSDSNSVTDLRDDTGATAMAQNYRQRLYQNPGSLADVLRIAPAKRDNQMVGYRVSPGKDREQFTQFGFQNNDIVTGINGITLDDPSKALEIYKLMRTAREATFDIDRNGEALQVKVALDQEQAN